MILKTDPSSEAYDSFVPMTSTGINLLDSAATTLTDKKPKRKPEKSRIVRVTKNDDEMLSCRFCSFEGLSKEDMERHQEYCRRSNSPANSPMRTNSEDLDNEAEPGFAFQSNAGMRDQILNSLSQPESGTTVKSAQQSALENIIKAQMSLSKLGSSFGEPQAEGPKEGPYSLLQQQLLHFQLIQLLQAQLSMEGNKKPEHNEPSLPRADHSFEKKALPEPSPTEKWNVPKEGRSSPRSPTPNNVSSMIIQHSESPPPSGGLNTLQMLQRTADEVLTNASKGLLANRLIDSVGEADNKDPELRHRCRYCGKVFSSDSALQIHIRSHTGERPFKCNICGNRFTTRGNLKVHFQRHSDRFPHIKMNNNPVPEHLDKFYPPLLQHMGEIGENGARPEEPPTPFSLLSPPGASPFLKNNTEHDLMRAVNTERLRETLLRRTSLDGNLFDFKLLPPFGMPPPFRDAAVESDDERCSPKTSFAGNEQSDFERERDASIDRMEIGSPEPHKTFSKKHTIDSLLLPSKDAHRNRQREDNDYRMDEDSLSDGQMDTEKPTDPITNEPETKRESSEFERKELPICKEEPIEKDLPERSVRDDMEPYFSDASSGPNESGRKSSPMCSPIQFSHFPFLGMPMAPKFSMLPGMQPHLPNSPPHSGSMMMPPSFDPAKVPDIYSSLLPRPGSNDNSWEALIEVENSDEKQKVERLMGKSRQKPTEPNQCGICLRVLSCKSALHMHYRIHTGERPFKCRICGRAFTTKGNLKTHMSVHRAKPPMRMFHQCTVCHKRFSNALILQQHIRLHTGEPTDLSPEQIAASEIRDFPMDMPMPMGLSPFSPNSLSSPLPPHPAFSPLLLPFPFSMPSRPPKRDSGPLESKLGNSFSSSPRSSSEGSSEHQSPEDLSMRSREEENSTEISSSRSLISPTSSDYSDAEDKTHNMPRSMHTPVSSILFSNTDTVQPHTTPATMSSPMDAGMKNIFAPFFPPLGMLSPFKSNLDLGLPNMNDPMRMGNTTCKICFKVFACQSALEIHYRSHTKERPFKCPVCDRGFSTKRKCPDHPESTAHPRTSSAEADSHKTDLGMKRDREDGIIPPEPKRTIGETDLSESSGSGRGLKPLIGSAPSILPLPASMNIPTSISHHPFTSPSRLASLPLPFPPSLRPPRADSLHLA